MKKIIASTFVAAAMVLAIPAPSNAASAADSSSKSSVTTPSKPAPVTPFKPFRIDWY